MTDTEQSTAMGADSVDAHRRARRVSPPVFSTAASRPASSIPDQASGSS
ncbi:hypothetical protein [Glycomyces rhizosphaerae]|uniref:Uncharacterized protein n=1 Tax=Glycomyces rhizosphaerae TaxID=2054422 RepID=A0ABV7Q7V9_9ACTN